MLAGQARGSYATFHAESAKEGLERFVSFGIEERALASLDLIVVQKRLSKNVRGQRFEERRVVEIAELIKPEIGAKEKAIGQTQKINLNLLYKYNYKKGLLEKCGESKRLLEKMTQTFSCSEKEIKKMLKQKQSVLEKLGKEVSFQDFYSIAENEM